MKYIKGLSEAERQTLPDAWDQLGLLGLREPRASRTTPQGCGDRFTATNNMIFQNGWFSSLFSHELSGLLFIWGFELVQCFLI
jgi:hypothetical protein